MPHYGWVITAASLVVGVTGYGTYFSFTLFYPFIVAEFGWSRAGVSGALSAGLVAYGVSGLVMGWCADRLGPRLTIAAGGVLFGLGTHLGAYVSELWHLYALYGGVTGIGMGATWAPLVSTVSRWFVRRRGLALGIATLGGGSGTLFVAPVVTELILRHGWREAYAVIGIWSGALMAAAALFMWRDPASRGVAPYGETEAEARTAPPRAGGGSASRRPAEPEAGVGLGRAVRTRAWWVLVLMVGLWWLAGAIVYVQLGPFMLEKGFDVRFAAAVVVAFGAGSGIGKIGLGMTTDRLGGRPTYRVATTLAAASMLGLALAGSPWLLLACALVLGVGFGGATPQLTVISVELFGLRAIGTMMGALLALMGTIGAIGPVLSGLVYDAGGSYAPAYVLGSAIFAASVALSFALRRPFIRSRSRRRPRRAGAG